MEMPERLGVQPKSGQDQTDQRDDAYQRQPHGPAAWTPHAQVPHGLQKDGIERARKGRNIVRKQPRIQLSPAAKIAPVAIKKRGRRSRNTRGNRNRGGSSAIPKKKKSTIPSFLASPLRNPAGVRA